MSDTNPYALEPIAIVAMAGRFPGAPTLDAFWNNLRNGVDSITRFTDEELRAAGLDAASLHDPHYVKAGAVLADAELFDAEFFGYLPREAAMLDPQHRLFLECAWQLLETGGYDPDRYQGLIGVFGGVATNSYLVNHLCQSPAFHADRASFEAMVANDKDYVTTRVAYKLNLRGPALTIQTACSTSLVAVQLACQHLWGQQCDMAIAGAAAVRCPPTSGYLHKEGMILSPDGRTRTFDANGQGTVMGSGVGLVLLKRLGDALAEGDQILALIRASAVNNDGATKAGYTAPSVQGQTEVIALAHQLAEVGADSISYVEAHGTATTVGDPIELAALTQAFRATTSATGFCPIGSVKSNIGHADAAAGMAGLIKTVLALTHREIPASLHFESPNPRIDFANSPFYVNTRLTPWEHGPRPRRAGVSSFGIGGTNAHVLLEEAPPVVEPAVSSPWQVLVLSAKTATALDAATASLRAFLTTHSTASLENVSWTLQVGRKPFAHRRAVVVRDVADAIDALSLGDRTRAIDGTAPPARSSTVFLFPGQGTQRIDMARELFDTERVFRQAFEECAERLKPHLGFDLTRMVYPVDPMASGLATEALRHTATAQPALFAVEYALVQLLQSWGVRPDAMIGHSIGEWVAACVAGVMSLDDALRLVAARGRLMQLQPAGAMLAVGLPENRVHAYLNDAVALAAVNSTSQVVLSGPLDAVEELSHALAADGVIARRLATAHAFHSSMMNAAADAFLSEVASVPLAPPSLPFISNLTGTWITSAQAQDPRYWCEHLRSTVRFADGIRSLLDTPNRLWLELGPGQTLGALVRQQSSTALVLSPSNVRGRPPRRHLLEIVGTLWAKGAAIEWPSDDASPRRRVALPTYPFERRRCWIDPPAAVSPPEREPISVTQSTEPATPPPVDTGTPASNLEATLSRVLQDLSGLDSSAIDVEASFLDMSFDSLMLTQAAVAFQKACGVPISFRQLLSETPNVRTLAASLERQGAATGAAAPIATSLIQRGSDVALTAKQRRHLETLVERYTRRTAESKRLTQQYRRFHADPRTSWGFNPLWKELVYPIVVSRSAGARLWDVDGNEYIDLLCGFGPTFLGHSSPAVTEALRAQLERGIEIGPQSPLAGQVAQMVCELTGMERVSFVNTGSEAVQAAIRVARTVTGRRTIALFAGDYHGNFDEVLVRVVSADGAAAPSVPGVPPESVANILVLEYGAPSALEMLRARASDIAGVLVEPVQSRRPEFQPRAFLHELRQLTRETGMLLIFDEVVTGFRAGPGGAQAFYGVQADLATYGKIAGGGMPIGLVAGKAEFMDTFDGGSWQYGDDSTPTKTVTFFRGTFIRHPLAMAAAHATLSFIKQQGPAVWRALDERTARLASALDAVAVEERLPLNVPSFCSLFYLRLQPREQPLAPLLFYHLRDRGIYLQEAFPSFLTLAHSDTDVDCIVERFRESVDEMRSGDCFAVADAPTAGRSGSDLPSTSVESMPLQRFPLTEAQHEIWMATRLGPLASAAYNESCVLHLKGPLQVDTLRRALADVVARHQAFRTAFEPDGGMQRIVSQANVPLEEWPRPSEPLTTAAVADLLARDSLTPFDLERPPLARATLLRLEPEYHYLVFTAHHIICDGWSTTRLLSELGARYSTLALDATAPPASPATPFRQLAEWQAAHGSSPAGAAAERYWLDLLSGDLPVLDLPADRSHPPERTFRAAREELAIDPELVERLKRLSATAGCTLVTTLLATFEVLLHRLTDQTDFVIGLPAAEHPVLGTTDIVGHGTNLLPLRVTIDSGVRFDEQLQATKIALLDAADHRHYTYGRLLRQLRLPRQGGRLPLVDVIFNIDRLDDDLSFRGLDVRLVDNERHAFTFDFGLNCVQTERTLLLQGDYYAEVYEAETIARWLSHYRSLLAAVVETPGRAVGALPLLTASERKQLIDWSASPMERALSR